MILPFALSRCEDVGDLLSEYLDGELAPRAAARVEVHLAICPSCARLAGELAAIVAALHRLPRQGRAAGGGRAPASSSSSR